MWANRARDGHAAGNKNHHSDYEDNAFISPLYPKIETETIIKQAGIGSKELSSMIPFDSD